MPNDDIVEVPPAQAWGAVVRISLDYAPQEPPRTALVLIAALSALVMLLAALLA